MLGRCDARRRGLIFQRCQFRPAAIEGRLDTAHGRIDQLRDFLQRVLKDIFQKDTRPLLRRKVEDQVLNSGDDGWRGRAGLDEVRLCGCSFRLLPHPSTPKKIDALVVCDAK